MDVQDEQIGRGQSRAQLSKDDRIFHIFPYSLCMGFFPFLPKFLCPSAQPMKYYTNNVLHWSPTGHFSHNAIGKMPTVMISFAHSRSSSTRFVSIRPRGGDGKLRSIHFGEHEVLILDHMYYHSDCPLCVKGSFNNFDLADLAII